jgi:hypothetical protein
MKNRIDFVFPEAAFQQRLIADIAAHHPRAVENSGPDEFGLRDPVSHQANHVRAGVQ